MTNGIRTACPHQSSPTPSSTGTMRKEVVARSIAASASARVRRRSEPHDSAAVASVSACGAGDGPSVVAPDGRATSCTPDACNRSESPRCLSPRGSARCSTCRTCRLQTGRSIYSQDGRTFLYSWFSSRRFRGFSRFSRFGRFSGFYGICRFSEFSRFDVSVRGTSENPVNPRYRHAVCPSTYQTTMRLNGTPRIQATKYRIDHLPAVPVQEDRHRGSTRCQAAELFLALCVR